MNTIRLYAHDLESMPEYSSTLPTGTTLWKIWRRLELHAGGFSAPPHAREDLQRHVSAGVPVEERWFVGQYVPCREHGERCPDHVGIRWFRVVLRAGPAPPAYRAPDWSNYARFQRERASEKETT